MKVKVCGLTSLEDAEMCDSMGADALGFVHFPGRTRSLPLEGIRAICKSLGPLVTKVLVCAPSTSSEGLRLLDRSGADALQLYSLSPKDLGELRSSGATVLRVVPPVREEALRFSRSADALVFEDGAPGTGSSYDYSRIPVDCHPRTIIAGGLNVYNLDMAKAMNPYALDVSSGVESAPGKKDPHLVREFIRRCRA